jgi:lysozyme
MDKHVLAPRPKFAICQRLSSVIVLTVSLCLTACLHRHQHTYPTVEKLTPGLFTGVDLTIPYPRAGEPRLIADRGIRLTKGEEGFRGYLYNDAAHYCTIAYGHLIKKLPCDGSEPEDFRRGISEPAGAELLTADMVRVRQAVSALVQVDLNDSKYAALCDFVYNVGPANFKTSTLLLLINEGDESHVPFELRKWRYSNHKEYAALITRREHEIKLYFEGQAIPNPPPTRFEDNSPIDIVLGEGKH